MKIKVELTTEEIEGLIVGELEHRIGSSFRPEAVVIKVRSKQNYREHEWENGEFQVTYEGDV